MERFINRRQELETLQEEYDRKGSSLVILYGRRRVGKTTLISEFINGKEALFFLASEESERQNRNAFQEKAADFIKSELLKNADFKNWDMIFRMIMDAPFQSKPIIVIDEFQYLGKANSAFPSIFQRIWEEVLKERSVMVILCGSLISMMESQTLSYDSPLYGRRTAQIRLKQISFQHYHEFFPDRSRRELIERYAVTGGVPKYIELFSGREELYDAIEKCVVNPSGYLYDEPHFLLQQEVSETGTYFSIMKAIAAGNRKLSDIAAVVEIKATSLMKYLKTLMDLDVLEREVPVTEERPDRSKKGLYRIKDNYLRFWFLFIYPNRSFIESGNRDVVMQKIRDHFISEHAAYVYEDVCREKMWEMNSDGVWPFHFLKIGRYWHGRTEIDLAAVDPNGPDLILGECKYWRKPMDVKALLALEEKAQNILWERDARRTWYVLFCPAGFTEELRNLSKNRDDVLLVEQ